MHGETKSLEVLGIECVVAGARIVVPSDSVDQIVEISIAALPHARPFVAGLAVHGGELLLAIRTGGFDESPRAVTKAVLLARKGEGMRIALAIDEVVSFVRARVRDDAGETWARRATSEDGRDVGWLDAERLSLSLVPRVVAS